MVLCGKCARIFVREGEWFRCPICRLTIGAPTANVARSDQSYNVTSIAWQERTLEEPRTQLQDAQFLRALRIQPL